jgi:hypothetical protein
MPGNRIVFDEESNYLEMRQDLYLPRCDQEVSRGFEDPTRSDKGPKVPPRNSTITRPLAYYSVYLAVQDICTNVTRAYSILLLVLAALRSRRHFWVWGHSLLNLTHKLRYIFIIVFEIPCPT